jgi:hypothetical protein
VKRSGFKRKAGAKGLRPDPEKVREFIRRGRQPLERGEGLSRRPKPGARPVPPRSPLDSGERPQRPPEGPLKPGVWRKRVWVLDDGRCRMCGKGLPSEGDSWVWHAHHAIEKQELRRRGLYHLVWDPSNGVLLCARCHRQHTAALPRVPGEKLPQRVRSFAERLGDWAEYALERAHPTTPSGGNDG